MAGRHRMPRGTDDRHGFRDGQQTIIQQGPRHLPPHPAVLEEELEIQHREMQKIMGENRFLVDENVFLQSDLTAVRDETHRLSQIFPAVRADKEAQTRELMERGLKLEAELKSTDSLKAEVVQLRAESQKLNTLRQELSAKVQSLKKDVNRCKADNQQVAGMKADIEGMHNELKEARRMYEFEKKANEELAEQNQAMEKDLVSMAREIEKLRAEQAGAEQRAFGHGFGGYGILNESPEMRYRGSTFGNPYANGPWGSYDRRGPPRR